MTMPRVRFSDRQRDEFCKTARTVAERPWNMHEAKEYLEQLVANNMDGHSDHWIPPDVSWMFKPVRCKVKQHICRPILFACYAHSVGKVTNTEPQGSKNKQV